MSMPADAGPCVGSVKRLLLDLGRESFEARAEGLMGLAVWAYVRGEPSIISHTRDTG